MLVVGCNNHAKQQSDGAVPNDTTRSFAMGEYWPPKPVADLTDKYNFNVLTVTECAQTKLSTQFDILINLKRYSDTTNHQDSCILTAFIREKHSKVPADTISITSLFYFDNTFANCDSVMSFTTKFNSKREVVDNYFGDIVVADLSFDNKDDIAIINDYGGNGGTFYSYFIQGVKLKFNIDTFLTDSVTYFPSIIDKSKQRLITQVPAGACCLSEDIYTFNKSSKTWKHTGHKIFGE